MPFNKNLLVAHLLLHLLLNDCHSWFCVRRKKSGLGGSVSVRGACRDGRGSGPLSLPGAVVNLNSPTTACLTAANLYCVRQMGLSIWVGPPCDFNAKYASALINPDSQRESHFAILGL